MTEQKPAQTGMDFPHDMPRQSQKKYVQSQLTPPKPTKADRKRLKLGRIK